MLLPRVVTRLEAPLVGKLEETTPNVGLSSLCEVAPLRVNVFSVPEGDAGRELGTVCHTTD